MPEFKITTINHFKEYIKGETDCWTLVKDIYAENGIMLQDYKNVATISKRDKFKKDLIVSGKFEEVAKIQKGAIILYKTMPWHCGIALDSRTMIHRSEEFDTRIERITEYGQKIAGIYMVKQESESAKPSDS